MSDYDTNYDELNCPFCNEHLSEHRECRSILDLDDEDYAFFQCPKCENNFKVSLSIIKEYIYDIHKPIEEEIKTYKLVQKDNEKENIIKDVPGQMFMWDNLFSDKS